MLMAPDACETEAGQTADTDKHFKRLDAHIQVPAWNFSAVFIACEAPRLCYFFESVSWRARGRIFRRTN